MTKLLDFSGPGAAPLVSLSVRHAADLYTRAVIYAVVPTNHTVISLHLKSDPTSGMPAVKSSEIVLSGGDGSDGVVATATVLEPLLVVSVQDRLVVADGCS